MPHTLATPAPRTGSPEAPSYRLTRLVAELSTHVHEQLSDGGAWRRWQATDARLRPFVDLAHVVRAWQECADLSVREALAALTVLGSTRGCDDELAAITALVLMTGGVCRMSRDLADVCEPEDVVVAMWLEIRRAERSVGSSVARHLIGRARQRLLREYRPISERSLRIVSIEGGVAGADIPDDLSVESDASRVELVDLLRWAEARGLMGIDEVALLAELVDEERAGASRSEALRRVGSRRGLAERTVRRHLQLALEALRRAVPDYLAATA